MRNGTSSELKNTGCLEAGGTVSGRNLAVYDWMISKED